ncbi:hypothetical protein [Acinetobacter baumannii]|uniref:hypothetical protein n=1 Tax=Acinetobacter baumannii TaxID=470 RepID=UPI0024DEEF7A|nr:hypothetical protein [Acinetobacter baumannii]MDK2220902.1 hypothetical protein [Acinetobacter baumannii]MDK2231961.1 hypothetical protein [Acinetobacter baumannii]
MDKCREEFESSLEHTEGFHDGYVTWHEAGGMYVANDDDYECMADWMNGAFAIHRKMQAKVEELEHKAGLRESDHKALLVKYQATKKCWEDISKEKDELQKRVDAAIKCADLNFWNANTVKAMVEALKGEGQ